MKSTEKRIDLATYYRLGGRGRVKRRYVWMETAELQRALDLETRCTNLRADVAERLWPNTMFYAAMIYLLQRLDAGATEYDSWSHA